MASDRTLLDADLRKRLEQAAFGEGTGFSQSLSVALERCWKPPKEASEDLPPELSQMLREENVAAVVEHAEANNCHLRAFHSFWDSGLFGHAERLLREHGEVGGVVLPDPPNNWDKIPFGEDLIERTGGLYYEFRLSEMMAKYGLWGRNKESVSLFRKIKLTAEFVAPRLNLRILSLVAEAGSEVREIAKAFHEISQREGEFAVHDCAAPEPDPCAALRQCHHGGTFLLEHADELAPPWRDPMVKAMWERQPATNRRGNDTVYLLEVREPVNMLKQNWIVNAIKGGPDYHPDLVVPSLAERRDDIPLLVNRILLELGNTPLGAARHVIGRSLMDDVVDRGVQGGADWLQSQVMGLVEEFLPGLSPTERSVPIPDPYAGNSPEPDEPVATGTRAEVDENEFRQTGGGTWFVRFEGEVAEGLPDRKGYHLIAFLLKNDHKSYSPLDLESDALPGSPVDQESESRIRAQIASGELFESGYSDMGVVMNKKGILMCKMKRAANDEALKNSDLDPLGKILLEEENESIDKALSEAVGLGGLQRKMDDAEVARKRVLKNYTDARDKLPANLSAFRQHLFANMRVGTSSKYTRPRGTSRWR